MASHTLYLFALIIIAAFTCFVMTASTSSSAIASRQTSLAAVSQTNSNVAASSTGYNEQGLPASVFPDYSGFAEAQTTPLDDGIVYLNDQNSVEKAPN